MLAESVLRALCIFKAFCAPVFAGSVFPSLVHMRGTSADFGHGLDTFTVSVSENIVQKQLFTELSLGKLDQRWMFVFLFILKL